MLFIKKYVFSGLQDPSIYALIPAYYGFFNYICSNISLRENVTSPDISPNHTRETSKVHDTYCDDDCCWL